MTWLCNQVRYLSHAIESHIVCEKTENLDQFGVPNIHSLPGIPLLSHFGESRLKWTPLYRMFWLWCMYRRINPSIVHSHFGNMGWSDSFVVRRTKASHVVTFYGLDVNMIPKQDPRWVRRYKSLFKSADLFLCEGAHMGECIVKLGCPPDKMKVHHLGVEVDKIVFKPRIWQSGEPLRVLIAAAFREKKGIPYALAALGQLQKKINIEITIIGDATTEPRSQSEKQIILNMIEKHGLHAKIRMLGFQPYSFLMEQVYKHHIFISPSVTAADGDTEGGAPVSIIEMAASGMPIISTKHCDIPSVIKHGQTGWLAKERDIEDLVEYLKWYVDHRDDWRKMLEAGRAHVETEFNAQLQGIRLGQIYRNLVAYKNDTL